MNAHFAAGVRWGRIGPAMSRLRERFAGVFTVLSGRAGGTARTAPHSGIERASGDGAWVATNDDPQFLLSFDGGLPRGLCRFELQLRQDAPNIRAKIFIDDGGGFREGVSRGWTVRPGRLLQTSLYISL